MTARGGVQEEYCERRRRRVTLLVCEVVKGARPTLLRRILVRAVRQPLECRLDAMVHGELRRCLSLEHDHKAAT